MKYHCSCLYTTCSECYYSRKEERAVGSVEEGEVVKYCPAGHALMKVEIEKFDKVIDI